MNEKIIKEAREILGLFLKNARKERNISQVQLAEMIGVNHMTISKIESGKFNFGIDIFNKLSIALGFKLELILKDDVNEKGRFDLIKEAKGYVLLDKESGLRIMFEAGRFNDSQKVMMPSNRSFSVSEIATIMRMAGDWLVSNYPKIV